MRVTLCVLLSLLMRVAVGQSSNSTPTFNVDSFLLAKRSAPLGKPFPAFTGTSDGQTVSSDVFKNKVVLVNFWYEGCLPCMAEMEALNALYEQLRNNKDFVFLSLTWENHEAIKRVKHKYGISYGVLSLSGAECRRLNFDNGYPTSIVVDRSGTLRYLHSGGSVDPQKAREFVNKTLLPEISSVL